MTKTAAAARSVMPVSDAMVKHFADVAAAAQKMVRARDALAAYEALSTRRRATLERELSAAITAFLEVRRQPEEAAP